uniref:Uncharacterized protein n=1 Tax=Arundo donax TaxID=35708 RepID=A0A0A9DWW5_ARUDO
MIFILYWCRLTAMLDFHCIVFKKINTNSFCISTIEKIDR